MLAGLMGRAVKKGKIAFQCIQLRDFSLPPHHAVDDRPFGGGEGMILRADVLLRAWQAVQAGLAGQKARTLLLSPQGRVWNQAGAKQVLQSAHLVLICGHYEGVDQRFIDQCVDGEISIGNYVVSGGELPALVVADTLTRLIPGVVGNPRSVTEETFEKEGLLKYPQYTRPVEFQGQRVPEVLQNGDHGKIALWREQQRWERTRLLRPDLLPQGIRRES